MEKALFICITLFFSLAAHANQYSERYFVTAKSGLIVRDAPNPMAKRVGKIPNGLTITLIEETGVVSQIKEDGNAIKGRWVKVEFNNFPYKISNDEHVNSGYVFSAFLKKLDRLDSLEITQLDQSVFKKLYRKIDKPAVKKIDSLIEAKKYLGNRVSWMKRNSVLPKEMSAAIIESITLANGHVLNINLEFGFLAYYPEEDIILFQDDFGTEHPISLRTGEYGETVGDPELIIESPTKKRRLNAWYPSQDCFAYFFQEKQAEYYNHLVSFGWLNGKFGHDVCTFNEFYWLNDDEFIYSDENGYYKVSFK